MAPKGIAASYPLLVINLPGTADVPLADKQVEITVATQGRLAIGLRCQYGAFDYHRGDPLGIKNLQEAKELRGQTKR